MIAQTTFDFPEFRCALSAFPGPAGSACLSARSWTEPGKINDILATNHYLGPVNVGFAWYDEAGVIVLANPRSRRLPLAWLELVRWCITSREKNAGSQQWARMVRELRKRRPEVTTIVSYSDPSQGHTGALYRACNWWWAPTWHRLRPPPTGNGSWTDGKQQAVKDRWIFALRRDALRVELLTAKDEAILRKQPHLRYREPGGVPYPQNVAVSHPTGGSQSHGKPIEND